MTETRADIKERMLRAASAAWGYADKIREVDFDPLLGLLMEVFSAELEKISNEISMSRERVLQRMVQLLAPDVLTAPVPAHAILHVQGLGEKLLLDDREQFFSSNPNPSGPSTREETWFSPAGSYYITDTAIKYLVMGERIIRYTGVSSRENWWPLKTALPSHTIWLGLTGKEAAVSGAQFYFELHHEQAGATFYHHLPDAQWWCGSQLLHIRKGFNSPEAGEGKLAEWLQAPHNISQAADRLARAIYQDRFVHVAQDEKNEVSDDLYRDDLYQVLPDAVREQWKNEKLVWIKIIFPESIQPATLVDLHCQVNCFPVVNRQLHELTYRLREWINIIPLSGERGQQFLDLHAVTDQDGNSLLGAIGRKDDDRREDNRKEYDNGMDETGRKMTVLLRRGGAGRFDERDARTVTEHLLQLLRDETAAFSLYNREFMSNEIKQVQQVITRISRQMETRDTPADATPYLEVMGNELGDSRHLAVSYWSTQGAKANQIKGGTALIVYKNGGVRQGTIVLMTPVQGGRNRLLPHESIPAYKSAVLSKDRILSAEDIRLFCIRETGVRGSSITVRKGVMIAQGRQSGYIKTIDVLICPDTAHYERMLAIGTPEHWQQVLQTRLAERSMSFMPFRVYLKKEYEPVN